MTTVNPFPGMNPYFEQRWRAAHTVLIAFLRDALQERLPSDLVAGAEVTAVAIGLGQETQPYRPDVQVREPWTLKEPAAVAAPSPSPTAADSIRLFLEEKVERWLEIRDTGGRLITVLEVLSPSNKLESAERDHYRRKRQSFISAGVNLVEIDLVRQGTTVFPEAIRRVFRAAQPVAYEVDPVRLRDRLPVIRIPLRSTDAVVVLDLQPLIHQCHEPGRYHLLDYHVDQSVPQLSRPVDARLRPVPGLRIDGLRPDQLALAVEWPSAERCGGNGVFPAAERIPGVAH